MNDYIHNKASKDSKLCQIIRKTITINRKEIGLEFYDVAYELGMNPGTLQNKLKPAMTTNDITITEFIHFLELTGDYAALQYIASNFDLVLINKHQSHSSVTNINILADYANMESADVFKVVKTTLRDGIMTSDKRKSILKEIEEADRANAELRDLLLNFAINEN